MFIMLRALYGGGHQLDDNSGYQLNGNRALFYQFRQSLKLNGNSALLYHFTYLLKDDQSKQQPQRSTLSSQIVTQAQRQATLLYSTTSNQMARYSGQSI